MNVYHELHWRGLIHQATADDLAAKLETDKMPMYIGFDPTATSLHAGSLIPLMALRHFKRCGHQVIVLIGGATGLIGDPSGKSEERVLETLDTVKAPRPGDAAPDRGFPERRSRPAAEVRQ